MAVAAQHHEARREGSLAALVRLWLDVARDVFTTAPREHALILKQDVGYALRALRRAPAFAISAVLTLAIGVAANTALFSIVNVRFFKKLPIANADRLVDIDSDELVARGLTPLDVVNTVNAQSLTLPSGTAKIGDKQYTVMTNATPGSIDDLNPERGKLKVMVAIFGRLTSVELEYYQVERL